MTLTPEQVKTKSFTITQFRDGFDMNQVDEYLDLIVEDLRERDAEKARLEEHIEQLNKELQEARNQNHESASAQGEGSQFGNYAEGDAQKSSAMLQLALELHDKYVHEGETKRDQLIQDGEQTSKRLVEEAQAERTDVLRKLDVVRADLTSKIEGLREFEEEYRNTLRSYIQSQLRGLEGSPEPAGAPELS